jgi:hypothetical protein
MLDVNVLVSNGNVTVHVVLVTVFVVFVTVVRKVPVLVILT